MGVRLGGWCLGVQSARDWWICEMGRSRSGMASFVRNGTNFYFSQFVFLFFYFIFYGSTTNHGGFSFGGVGFMS